MRRIVLLWTVIGLTPGIARAQVVEQLQPEAAEPAQEPAAPPAQEQAAPAAAAQPTDPKQYAQHIRTLVQSVRGKVRDKLEDKLIASQEAKMDRIAGLLSLLALAGLLLLGTPLVLARRYPGQLRTLFKYSALAALTFYVALNLFALVILTLRGVQGVAGHFTNPQVRIVEAAFDTIEEKAEDLALMGPAVLEPTLSQLGGDTDEPLPVVMLHNVQRFRTDLAVFGSVARFFKGLSFLFGALPIVLTLVALVLFVLATRPVLTEIVLLPVRAAQGQARVGRQVLGRTFRRVGQEMLATLCLIGFVVAVTLVGAGLLSVVLKPAVEAFLAYLMVAFLYIQLDQQASAAAILFSLTGTLVFLACNLAVILLSSAFFLGKTQKILQRRFVDKVPLRAHGRFWKWGTLALVWAQLVPLLYILGAQPLVGWLIEKTFDPARPRWGLLLVSGPALLVVLFAAAFWAARGLAALGFLGRYPVTRPVVPTMPEALPNELAPAKI